MSAHKWCRMACCAGDGQPNCTASAALPGILAQYTTTGPGQVACSQGTDVAYSAGAPGFAYDPTGSSNLSVSEGPCRLCFEITALMLTTRRRLNVALD